MAAILVVVSFYVAGYTDRYHQFHWFNLVCGIILIPVNLALDVGFGAFLTAAMAFGSVIYFYKSYQGSSIGGAAFINIEGYVDDEA